jgi:hypothetical protein
LDAVEADERFEIAPMGGYLEPPFDLQFLVGGNCPEKCKFAESCRYAPGELIDCNHFLPRKTFHVELKDFTGDDSSDYLASILSGHLYEQILAARERQEPVAVVVLGDDSGVGAAIRKAASYATAGHRVDPEKLMEYYRMVEGFEANCIALNVQVWRLKTDPYGRMLLRVRKILEGGDLTGFAPAPAEGERQAVGLSILAGKGIGPVKARAILEKFDVCIEPKQKIGYVYLDDCDGIGPKLAEKIGQALHVEPAMVIRPPKPKKQKAEGK